MTQETVGSGSVKVESTLTMTVTDMARDKLATFLGPDRKIAEHGVRILVQPGGCSGASYGMEFAKQPAEGEMTLTANGVRIFVRPDQALLLNGLTVDFVDELMGGGFKIHNPNATSSCACGKSFSA